LVKGPVSIYAAEGKGDFRKVANCVYGKFDSTREGWSQAEIQKTELDNTAHVDRRASPTIREWRIAITAIGLARSRMEFIALDQPITFGVNERIWKTALECLA